MARDDPAEARRRKPEPPISVFPPDITWHGRKPPWVQIADWLEARIKAGDFNNDVPLPSEYELVEEFGVARETVRKAIKHLREIELVETLATRGTFAVRNWRNGKPVR